MDTPALDLSVPPFDLLSPEQIKRLSAGLHLEYFEAGQVIIRAGSAPEGLYIILKGKVEEYDGNTLEHDSAHLVSQYSEGDLFGSLAVLKGQARDEYLAFEEAICQCLPAHLFLDLVHENPEFRQYFHKGLASMSKQHLRSQNRREGDDFSLVRVGDSVTRKGLVVSADSSIRETVQKMRAAHIDSALVDFPGEAGRYGLVTGTDLLNATALDGYGPDESIAGFTGRNLIAVEAEAFLFEALTVMARHHIKRVVVKKESAIVGVAELADVLGFLSSRSHSVGVAIEKARSIEDLLDAAEHLNPLVRNLVDKGTRIRFLMDLLAALNNRLVAKVWELTVSDSVRENTALVVLGSEGRGEQIVRTDQDNCLIVRDGFDWPTQAADCQRFIDRLIQLGFPPCPGNIMISNPMWVQTESQWVQTIDRWVLGLDETTLMNLAIVMDGHRVAGDAKLFDRMGRALLKAMTANDIFISHFATPCMHFAVPLTLFGNVKKEQQGVDIKKGAIFPLVHGIRALSLKNNVRQSNTFKRIQGLVRCGGIHEKMGRNLESALVLFSDYRLRSHLRQLGANADVTKVNNYIEPKRLNRLERDMLREGLHVVKEFKDWLESELHIRG
ncbi:cyclic nucleotide-binding domain-containing protein [Litorivicinus lipolyticus]|uniref:Cyclic nucleotide-binding domain-containing protein n=1 Tax=Litorivicinus lipolyticus TaxID=418701 RepID=A0A5Q2QAT5_9GAMM|nr:DUF294 nucleotidyltransferase-like domain-containing protein [Litorivicinus lipolyticus]QGG80373.1 cyclic nucleotide-binding domain-containing protein [Litorivicinus lipolyticus]